MTANEARAVAKFLGEPHEAHEHQVDIRYHDTESGLRYFGTLTDADLLLAILERAARLDRYIGIDTGFHNDWHCNFSSFKAIGPTPLAAAIAAVCRYQEGK